MDATGKQGVMEAGFAALFFTFVHFCVAAKPLRIGMGNYPYPVQYFSLKRDGQDLKMALHMRRASPHATLRRDKEGS